MEETFFSSLSENISLEKIWKFKALFFNQHSNSQYSTTPVDLYGQSRKTLTCLYEPVTQKTRFFRT